MKIANFDRVASKVVQAEALEALRAVAAQHGLTLRQAGGTIGGDSLTLKFEFKVDDPAAQAVRDRDVFVALCDHYGLKPEHFGGMFPHKGRMFEVVGLEPGRPKFCVRAREVGGDKVLLFPAAVASKVTPAPVVAAMA